MVQDYTHLDLDKDYPTGIAGFYTPLKEVRLKCDGREVLYVVGQAVIEAACCGRGTWGYVLVPGYIVSWQSKRNQAGLPVSEVEPISDEAARHDITDIIKTNESIPFISFW